MFVNVNSLLDLKKKITCAKYPHSRLKCLPFFKACL